MHDCAAPLVDRNICGNQTIIQVLLLVPSLRKVPGLVLAMSQMSVPVWQGPVGYLEPVQFLSIALQLLFLVP